MPVKKVIYAASVMHENDFSALFAGSDNMPGQQAQKFNRLMVDGIEKNGVETLVISAPPITRRNCNRRLVALGKKRQGNTMYRYLPIFNVRYIKNPFVVLSSLFHTLFASIGRKSIVVCDVLNISVSMGAVIAGRLLGKRCVGIVTDLPELMATGQSKKQVKYCYKLMRMCTGYVLLTEQMNEVVNLKSRPYIVLEGHADLSMKDVENRLEEKYPQKVCLYAGSLMKIYGIESLVKGFVNANIPDTELHIYGDGDFKAELEEFAKHNESVKYMGVVPNSEIVKAELKATLLINPRPTNEEYTKYSFPSKNMEYMASGTPVLTTELPGMPQDHKPYVYFIKNETAEGIAEALKDVFKNSSEELHAFGLTAKDFILKEKNNISQAKKVLDFITKSF